MDRHQPGPYRLSHAALIGLIIVLTGCQEPRDSAMPPSPEAPSNPSPDSQVLLDNAEQTLADAVTNQDSLPGASIYIIAPTLGINGGAGVGYADAGSERPFWRIRRVRSATEWARASRSKRA